MNLRTLLVLAGCAAIALIASVTAFAAGSPRRPDLVVTRIVPLGASVTRGQRLMVHAIVRERLNVRAARSTARFYLSSNRLRDRTDVLLGRAATPALRRGSAMVMPQLRIPAAGAAGRYFVLACADDLRVVREAIETNNCTSSAGRVVVTRPTVGTPTDTTAPAAPSKPVTFPAGSGSVAAPVVSGTAEAGATVRLYDADANGSCTPVIAALATTSAAASGAWEVTAPALASGTTVRYVASATDAAGNVSTCSTASDSYTYTAAGGGTPPPPPPANTFTTPGNSLSPSSLSVATGTQVTWQLRGVHSVVSDGVDSFPGSGGVATTYSFTFTTPGSYHFHCGVHPSMTGTVTVT